MQEIDNSRVAISAHQRARAGGGGGRRKKKRIGRGQGDGRGKWGKKKPMMNFQESGQRGDTLRVKKIIC